MTLAWCTIHVASHRTLRWMRSRISSSVTRLPVSKPLGGVGDDPKLRLGDPRRRDRVVGEGRKATKPESRPLGIERKSTHPIRTEGGPIGSSDLRDSVAASSITLRRHQRRRRDIAHDRESPRVVGSPELLGDVVHFLIPSSPLAICSISWSLSMSSPASVTVTISLYSFTFLTSSHVCVYDLVGKQPQAVVAQGTAGLLELPARRRLQGLLLGAGTRFFVNRLA